jgi:hypothetical protein
VSLYEGWVGHRRYGDVEHAFRYRLALVYLDADALDRAPALGPLGRVRREDLFGDPAVPLTAAIRAHVNADGGTPVRGPVRVLTAVRALGIGFNPVRFYYCFGVGADGVEELEAVVAEVTNTPWGERHAYVLRPDPGGRFRGEMAKELHVSPFLGMDHSYGWSLTVPGDELEVRLENLRDGVRQFDARLRLRRRPLTRGALARALLRQGPQSLRVVARIYGQAVRLKLKGAPYHPHPRAAA